MREIPYSKVDYKQYLVEGHCLYKEIEKRLMNQYDVAEDNVGLMCLSTQLAILLAVSDGKLTDKKIIDLGCGATQQEDGWSPRRFEPWLCRALYELNVPIVGVDKGKLEEKFPAFSIDLLASEALRQFSKNHFDIVYSCQLFSSPSLKGKGWNLEKMLKPEVERLLKPEGVYVHTGWYDA